MKFAFTATLGLLILATSTLQQDNFCKHGSCDDCTFGTDLKTRSCISCRKGTNTLVIGSTALAQECVDNLTVPNCKRAYKRALLSTDVYCDECNSDFQISTDRKSCTAVAVKIPNCMWYTSTGTCSTCKSGYFKDLTSLVCTEVPVKIEKCD